MSDVRLTTIENASSGFNNEKQQQPRQQQTDFAQIHKAQQALKSQRRQEETAWNTFLFLLDAHKDIGQRHIFTTRCASSVLLVGSPKTDHTTMTPTTTTAGSLSHKHTALSFTQYTKLCALHKAESSLLVSEVTAA